MTKILQGAAFVGFAVLWVNLVISAFEKSEIAECAKLQAQAAQYADRGFYVTDWQRDMCAAHDMAIVILNK